MTNHCKIPWNFINASDNKDKLTWNSASDSIVRLISSTLKVIFGRVGGDGRLSVRVMMHLVIPLHFRYTLFYFIDNSFILLHNVVISRTRELIIVFSLFLIFRVEENERMERDRQKQQQKQQMQRISQNQSDNDAPHQPLFGVPFKVRSIIYLLNIFF